MGQSNTQVIAISSGKGGVGKTTLAVNLGIAMARQSKVCLFDADTNLANINIMLRETPLYTLQHVLDGEKSISEIIIHSNGISLVPGASGVTNFEELERSAQIHLLRALSELEQLYDVILVDTSAGISSNVLDFIQAAHQCIVVITPEPTSLTDSFSLLRMLRKQKYRKRINVVVNQADAELGARKVFKRFSAAVAKYIGYHPAYIGYVNKDDIVSSAICSQVPVTVYKPNAVSSQCFNRLSENLHSLIKQQAEDKSLTDSWRKKIIRTVSKVLPESVSSHVPGDKPVAAPKKKSLLDKKEINKNKSIKYQQADRIRKKQVLADHKQAMIEYIEDSNFNKQEIALTLDHFLNCFFKRFKDYPSDLVVQINSLLQTNALPQAKINQLQSELMLFYKDNRLRVDRDYNAEFLNQQIDDYVDEYGQYPFDTSQALMQSIGMGQVTNEAILELDTILSLVGESRSTKKMETTQQVFATDIEHDRTELADELTEKIKENQIPQKASVRSNDLKDSIRFASKLAE